jgi:hypothetical protein
MGLRIGRYGWPGNPWTDELEVWLRVRQRAGGSHESKAPCAVTVGCMWMHMDFYHSSCTVLTAKHSKPVFMIMHCKFMFLYIIFIARAGHSIKRFKPNYAHSPSDSAPGQVFLNPFLCITCQPGEWVIRSSPVLPRDIVIYNYSNIAHNEAQFSSQARYQTVSWI